MSGLISNSINPAVPYTPALAIKWGEEGNTTTPIPIDIRSVGYAAANKIIFRTNDINFPLNPKSPLKYIIKTYTHILYKMYMYVCVCEGDGALEKKTLRQIGDRVSRKRFVWTRNYFYYALMSFRKCVFVLSPSIIRVLRTTERGMIYRRQFPIIFIRLIFIFLFYSPPSPVWNVFRVFSVCPTATSPINTDRRFTLNRVARK